MTKNKIIIGLVILGCIISSGTAIAMEPQLITLAEAEEIAFENSISLYLASLTVEEANLGKKQAEAAAIMHPSPTMLMQVQAGVDLATQQYLMAKDSLALEVKTDFFNVLRLQNLLEIAEDALKSAGRNLDVTEKRYNAGTVTQLDVIQATRNLLSSQANITQLQHNLELVEMKFRQTLGLALEANILPETTAFEIQTRDIDLEADLEFALANREEISQLEVAVSVAEKSVELADNDYTPEMELEQTKLNLEKMRAQLDQVKQFLTLEIRQNYAAIKEAEQRIPVLEKGVEEAEEMLRLTELMYESHMIVSSDLADVQLAVTSAKNDLINAIYDYQLASSTYSYAAAEALR